MSQSLFEKSKARNWSKSGLKSDLMSSTSIAKGSPLYSAICEKFPDPTTPPQPLRPTHTNSIKNFPNKSSTSDPDQIYMTHASFVRIRPLQGSAKARITQMALDPLHKDQFLKTSTRNLIDTLRKGASMIQERKNNPCCSLFDPNNQGSLMAAIVLSKSKVKIYQFEIFFF
jgi:hypothetical protein